MVESLKEKILENLRKRTMRRKRNQMSKKEGWGLPQGSKKAHYFLENGMSLCNKYGFYRAEKEQGNDDSNDNCTACKKALKRKREREQADQRLKELDEKGKVNL